MLGRSCFKNLRRGIREMTWHLLLPQRTQVRCPASMSSSQQLPITPVLQIQHLHLDSTGICTHVAYTYAPTQTHTQTPIKIKRKKMTALKEWLIWADFFSAFLTVAVWIKPYTFLKNARQVKHNWQSSKLPKFPSLWQLSLLPSRSGDTPYRSPVWG